ncbi:hypothetical protein NHX12_014942 [Muraenolepis orangiensis]|uniref:Uncharacterized protein n=1 Tax=Muraenolepis orangiensis TaxID=630683 RepID=A0A9Q0DD32_9TELE|nr:hypothetical protein NHX12_014942 [Muraenolepis orangiensis]
MASPETPPPSLRQGVRIAPHDSSVSVEEALLAAGEQVSPLSVPSTRITVSGVPPFIPSELLEVELRRFVKFASGFKTVVVGVLHPQPGSQKPLQHRQQRHAPHTLHSVPACQPS